MSPNQDGHREIRKDTLQKFKELTEVPYDRDDHQRSLESPWDFSKPTMDPHFTKNQLRPEGFVRMEHNGGDVLSED